MYNAPRIVRLLAAVPIFFAVTGTLTHAATTARVASSLHYPVFVAAPANDGRLFIVEQQGVIKILQGGTVLSTPFLDISALIPHVVGNDERGLLGLAFDPAYAVNGRFYLDYINLSGNTVIARYLVSGNPDVADPTSAEALLTINQPYPNHNGGTLAFGPHDGLLYIGMGDGGSAGDPGNRAQNPQELLGKMLRIDVSGNAGYQIPPSNPFYGNPAYRGEIWALGLRNPYRWSFDRVTGDLWIGDVGQDSWEEIDYQPGADPGGENYGWRLMEGDHCYNPPSNCDPGGLTYPIYEYSHANGCSITGGSLYRGSAIPEYTGDYFFSDFCSARIWSLRYDGHNVTDFTDHTSELAPGGGLTISQVVAIGEDANGELYIVDRGSGTDGEVYKIISDQVNVPHTPMGGGGLEMSPPRPNPFTGSTEFAVTVPGPGRMWFTVTDAIGRSVHESVVEATSAGRRVVTWDGLDRVGRAVPPGVYLLRARFQDGTSASRMAIRR